MTNQTANRPAASPTPAQGSGGGLGGRAPAFAGTRATVSGTLATIVSLLVLAAIGRATDSLLLVAPLAATAMIICASPALPPAQPRGVLLGQLGSAVIGFAAGAVAGHSLWTASVAAGLSVGLMGLLRAVHAPAAATAVLVVVQHPAPARFLLLLAAGSVLLILVGLLASRIGAIGKYPTYWW
ncbi:HPP family protein [Kitasatospora sp. NPDC085879]|uniref:HPP family protein n=1 Tax=Kitasatospora sp. NPDC085879 TaxID=3154769 RepID=UPI000BB0E6B0|nr:HPP family protein [Streptomyces sp. TLI_235]PBC78768.1 HPP family protein [Streptomyces sp. TLI_235]